MRYRHVIAILIIALFTTGLRGLFNTGCVPEPVAHAGSRAVTANGLGAYALSPQGETQLAIVDYTGQSLGAGGDAFEAGVPATMITDDSVEIGDTTGGYLDANASSLYLAPLVWPGRPFVDANANVAIGNNYFPQNRIGEGSDYRALRAAKRLFSLSGLPSYRWAAINVAMGGQGINCIKPDSSVTTISPNGNPCNSFPSAIDQTTSFAQNAAVDAGLSSLVVAGVDIHGEADCVTDQNAFMNGTLDMLGRYQFLQQSITHQTRPIPWIITQQHSRCTGTYYNLSNWAQWMMALRSYNCGPASGNPVCAVTTGTYWYQSYDGTHHTAFGYEQLGAWIAKWLTKFESWQRGGPWQETLIPTAFSYVSGTHTLTITFNVPAGSLIFDTSNGEPHQAGTAWGPYWANCHGFETWNGSPNITVFSGDAAGPPTVVGCTSATIVGNTVVIVGAAPFTHIAYAMTPDDLNMGCASFPGGGATGHTGAVCGSVGSLRDTDPTIDPISNLTIPDWAVSIPWYPVTWSGPTCWDGGC